MDGKLGISDIFSNFVDSTRTELPIYEEINVKYLQYFEGSYNTLEQELGSA